MAVSVEQDEDQGTVRTFLTKKLDEHGPSTLGELVEMAREELLSLEDVRSIPAHVLRLENAGEIKVDWSWKIALK